MEIFVFIALICFLLISLWFIYRKNFKKIKTPAVTLITGGVKCGKSLLSVKLAIKDYRHRHRVWWIKTHVFKKIIEEPLFYTNCKISFGNLKKEKPHKLDSCIRAVTLDTLTRELRFNYGSIIYINEASLMADNMDFANKERNCDLSLFAKLIGHETRGGVLYLDTQSVLDVHYAFKRVSSTYLFIQKNINLFFFHILYVREMINTENGVNNFEDDVDCTTRKVLIPFWFHHKYDRYEWSYLTDELQREDSMFIPRQDLKSFNPLYVKRSFKHYKSKEESKK